MYFIYFYLITDNAKYRWRACRRQKHDQAIQCYELPFFHVFFITSYFYWSSI